MVYADYQFYAETYGGTAITAEDWPARARRASAYLDLLTFGRLKGGADVTDDVRMAVCAVAEAEQVAAVSATGVKSENVDGYSVTYEDGAARAQCLADARLAAVDLYLSRGDPLRYAGVT